MTRQLVTMLTAVALAVHAAMAASVPANTCHAVFRGTSTLHDFEGTVEASVVEAGFGEKGWSLRIECPIAGMDTRNAGRDKNMRRMFDYPKFPFIVCAGRDLPWPAEGKSFQLPMTLKILNRKNAGKVTLDNWSLHDGVATFTLKGTVSLAAFELKPPGVLLGMIRVGDRVELEGRLAIHNWPAAARK